MSDRGIVDRRPRRGAVRGDPVPVELVLPLVPAKTARPRLVRAGVDRPHLTGLLEAAVRHPVTLVCAGAGWGKTVLVSDWARDRSDPVAWLSLDRHDNNPLTFWAYVLAALRVAGVLTADNPLADLGVIPADELERTRRLAAGLALLPPNTVLVIDDIQEVDDPGVLRELAELLRYPSPALHLLVVGRAEPPLMLHRLRAAGQLAEIRTGELAFTNGEAADLLARHGLALSPDAMSTLVDRTEGWVTGLQLGAAFLGGRDGSRTVTDFAGDVRGVDEYLTDEVLAACTRRQRRFLLQTSICENVCADLANAITRRTDGQHILEQIERNNDFMVRLGAKPLWYRYHHLLRDVLGHRLLLENPAALPELHRRASRWHAANDAVMEALTHAVSGQDWPYLGRLITTQGAPLMVSAHRPALVKILQQVPVAEFSSTPELMICAALLLFHTGDYDAIPARLTAARERLSDRPDGTREPFEITAHLLQLAADRAVGDMPAVIEGCTRLLDLLADARTAPVSAIAQNRAIALSNKGLGLLWTELTDDAERHLWAAANAARAATVELSEINSLGHLALLHVMTGSVNEAAQLAANAGDLAERRGWRFALQTVAAHLAHALVALERHNLDDAERALRLGRRAHHSDPEAAQRLVLLGVQARLATARGDYPKARQFLAEAAQDRNPRLHVPAIDRRLALAEANLDLATGRADKVEQRYAAQPAPLTPAEQICRARAAYALGDLDRAEHLLAAASPPARDATTGVEAGVLAALIADSNGHTIRATDLLSDAVALAGREGIRRPFGTMAEPRLDRLLQRLKLLSGQEIALSGGSLRAGTDDPGTGRPVVDLSERETEILRYLTTMLTAAEIAADLGLSVNTVKAHMRAVYRKLGASRRSQAVTLARDNGIL